MQGLIVLRRADMRAAAGTLWVRCLADSGWDRLTNGGGFMQWFAAALDAVVCHVERGDAASQSYPH